VYVTGREGAPFNAPPPGGDDAYLVKYNTLGNQVWSTHIDLSIFDIGTAVTTDGFGNAFVVGSLQSNALDINAQDAFVSKINSAGVVQWSRQLASPSGDQATGAATDSLGNVYVSGITHGQLGATHAGSGDAFVSKFDPLGNLIWTQQWGTNLN